MRSKCSKNTRSTKHFWNLFEQTFLIRTISDNLDAVNELIYYVNLASNDGETALDRAAKFGREKIVELLIHNGANIDPIRTNRYAPLSSAATNGKRNSL